MDARECGAGSRAANGWPPERNCYSLAALDLERLKIDRGASAKAGTARRRRGGRLGWIVLVVLLAGAAYLFRRPLQSTEIGFADQLASAAVMLMGEADEATPVVIVRGLAWPSSDAGANALVRPAEHDLFT